MRKAIFDTHGADSTWNRRSGEAVNVLRPLTAREADIFDVGDMYKVQFTDGTDTDAFADELTFL